MEDTILQGAFTLGGVMIGAAASFGAVAWTETRRWNLEQRSRWDSKRLEAYTDYATAVKLSIIQSRSILGGQGLSPTLTPIEPEVGLSRLSDIEYERTAKLEAVMLLATETTIAAAREWHGIAWTFHKWASGQQPTTSEVVEDGYRSAQIAREAYYAAVRDELGV